MTLAAVGVGSIGNFFAFIDKLNWLPSLCLGFVP
jgi:hypothetical protein